MCKALIRVDEVCKAQMRVDEVCKAQIKNKPQKVAQSAGIIFRLVSHAIWPCEGQTDLSFPRTIWHYAVHGSDGDLTC